MTKKLSVAALAGLLLAVSSISEARDSRHMLSIKQAMSVPTARAKLSGDIQLLFGREKNSGVVQRFGEFTSNRKTNALNKSDTEACNWVFLSALLALQERARREGANAVVNIRSYYKKHEVASETQFECGAGTFVAGVALKGDVVTLE